MMNTILESKSAELSRFQDALDAARAKGPGPYDALFNAPPEGMSVHEINADKILTRVSPAHERLLGYPSERMTGQPASSFVILRESSEMAMSRKLSGSGALEPYVRAFLKADGSAVTLLLIDRRKLDAAGKVLGICTVLTPMPSPPATGTWTRPPGFPGTAGPGGSRASS
ncbi:MAG: PAS domain S-box protein [Holophagales bacterium]|jgi:PAS domain S-box-containing protein|nr:PAS domain S-box protein [Holophagales bacterium]MBK9965613.1 PAS domain S-box protein [Holophagales bacterium]